MTIWALLGAVDWDALLTATNGVYETGAYDVSGPTPRPTAIAELVSDLARREQPRLFQIAAGSGWWHRDVRSGHDARPAESEPSKGAPILITGATGTLGQAFVGACALRGLPYVLTDRERLDINDRASVERALDRHQPHLVINATGWVRVDEAETEEAACHRTNAVGAALVARAASERGIGSVHFSSDLVFGGVHDVPWVENRHALARKCLWPQVKQ